MRPRRTKTPKALIAAASAATVLSIHNLGYQGVFGAGVIGDLGIAGSEWRLHQDDLALGTVNLLKTGLLWADELTTVVEVVFDCVPGGS